MGLAECEAVQSGPIRVSENGHHFVDAQGRPFFWLGDTAWPLFGQYTQDDAARYLQNRAERGFTVIQGVLAWVAARARRPKCPSQTMPETGLG